MHPTFQRLSLFALAMGMLVAKTAQAADHDEAPGVIADRIADIDDVYAWHTDDGKVIVIVTFGGVGGDPVGPPSEFDADLLYGIHLDNDGDFISDQDIWARFGQDALGIWGVQFENIPGSTGTVSGAINTTIDAGNGLSAAGGVYDDPFFFDLTGLGDTLATATLSFDNTRDSFAGKNTNAIVVEMDTVAATSNNAVRIWATTARK